MSQENVEVVRASYEAVTRGNFEDSLSAYTEDTEWDDTRVRPDGGIQRGREAVGDRARTWAGTFSEYSFELEEVVDAGEQVVVSIATEVAVRPAGSRSSTAGDCW